MKIGDLIRCWRAINRYSVRELAKEIGTSSATLSRVEKGEMMDGGTLAKILVWVTK